MQIRCQNAILTNTMETIIWKSRRQSFLCRFFKGYGIFKDRRYSFFVIISYKLILPKYFVNFKKQVISLLCYCRLFVKRNTCNPPKRGKNTTMTNVPSKYLQTKDISLFRIGYSPKSCFHSFDHFFHLITMIILLSLNTRRVLISGSDVFRQINQNAPGNLASKIDCVCQLLVSIEIWPFNLSLSFPYLPPFFSFSSKIIIAISETKIEVNLYTKVSD